MNFIKKILKIIIMLIVVFMLFIIINLIIWWIKYKSFRDYANMLEQKSRNESIEDLTRNPISWISIFYEQADPIDSISDATTRDLLQNIDVLLPWDDNWLLSEEIDDIENIDDIASLDDSISWWQDEIVESSDNNPYDPDYEDEFNSFFAWN